MRCTFSTTAGTYHRLGVPTRPNSFEGFIFVATKQESMNDVTIRDATVGDVTELMRVTEQAWAVAYGDIFSRETIDTTMEELRESDVTCQIIEHFDDDSEQPTDSDKIDEDFPSSESGGNQEDKAATINAAISTFENGPQDGN